MNGISYLFDLMVGRIKDWEQLTSKSYKSKEEYAYVSLPYDKMNDILPKYFDRIDMCIYNAFCTIWETGTNIMSINQIIDIIASHDETIKNIEDVDNLIDERIERMMSTLIEINYETIARPFDERPSTSSTRKARKENLLSLTSLETTMKDKTERIYLVYSAPLYYHPKNRLLCNVYDK